MMGGSEVDDDWELACPSNDAITLVLVGKLGYGKSATGNSILGRKAFLSKSCLLGVTSTCEMHSTILEDGRTVKVIDTPGFFDKAGGFESDGKEIVKCISMAKDGIHALLMVFSTRVRFSEEEETTIARLKMVFGEKVIDYMIVVFTGGDELEENEMTFREFLNHAPETLKKIIQMCKNRVMLFNNKTKDRMQQASQVRQLLYFVDSVVQSNGGKPFSDQLFVELKKGASKLHHQEKEVASLKGYSEQEISELKEEIYKSYDDQLARITKMVEQKLNDTIERLEKQLAEEQAARLESEKFAKEACMRSDEEIRKLKENLEKARKENEEFRKLAQTSKCAIL